MDETKLLERLALVEALAAGAAGGEKLAAEEARRRLIERIKQLDSEDPPIAFKFQLTNLWQRKIFLALARRYGLSPYRIKGQRHTTVMVKVSRRFVDETLWPAYVQLSDLLNEHLEEITDRILEQGLGAEAKGKEADEVEQLALPGMP
ncbi:MAG: hypothetical protein H7338_03555 [Candidatus Sericytochromatia bacterium]|nr:hypothetical protein [Candidatus Sericytochromatia bacterium]